MWKMRSECVKMFPVVFCSCSNCTRRASSRVRETVREISEILQILISGAQISRIVRLASDNKLNPRTSLGCLTSRRGDDQPRISDDHHKGRRCANQSCTL